MATTLSSSEIPKNGASPCVPSMSLPVTYKGLRPEISGVKVMNITSTDIPPTDSDEVSPRSEEDKMEGIIPSRLEASCQILFPLQNASRQPRPSLQLSSPAKSFAKESIASSESRNADSPGSESKMPKSSVPILVPGETGSPSTKKRGRNELSLSAPAAICNDNAPSSSLEDTELMGLEDLEKDIGGKRKAKRRRKTPEQLSILEQQFKMNPMPDKQVRDQLGYQLGLTSRQVQIWFQNKRAKAKNERKTAEQIQAQASLLKRPHNSQYTEDSLDTDWLKSQENSLEYAQRFSSIDNDKEIREEEKTMTDAFGREGPDFWLFPQMDLAYDHLTEPVWNAHPSGAAPWEDIERGNVNVDLGAFSDHTTPMMSDFDPDKMLAFSSGTQGDVRVTPTRFLDSDLDHFL